MSEYDHGHSRLEHAGPDVQAVADLLTRSTFDCTVLRDPDEQAARAGLKKLRGSMQEGGGSLVLLWSGHAVRSPADLRLLARDSGDYADDGLAAGSDVAAPCAQSGASQLLLIIDTCFSGEAVTAGELATRIMQLSPPEGEHVWVGVLASCLPEEKARDGVFGQRLAELLKSGPEAGPDTQAMLVQRWSPQSEYIRGDDLCDAILKTWGTTAHTPVFQSNGSAWWMFPNPRYNPGAPERVVEHLLLAARGGAGPDDHSWFTGRTAEVDQVVAWVRSNQPGLHVITGSAGTGKTAIAGRVVSLSNPAERTRLLAEAGTIAHSDPGERSVAAHVHARGLTADRAADSIADQLVRAEVLTAQPDRRNAAELTGQLQRAVEHGAIPPVIVVDGLDEARVQAFPIAEELLLRLAPYATVIVSTRERRRGETEPSLLDVLTAGTAELNLDEPAAQERGRADMRAYIADRLAGLDPRMDPDAVAVLLAGEASMTGDSPFLLARLVTDQLRSALVDTSQPDWQDTVSQSVEDAFDADLARVHAGEPARRLLAALTWGFGAGMPEEEWLACAKALGDNELGRDDITWVLDELGRYVIQDGEAGLAVYRMAHQSLADHIRPPFVASHQQVFDPQARPVAAALLGRYAELLANGVQVTAPGYLWRYAWRHAATAGPAGLELIRDLAASEPLLLPDVALADQDVASRFVSWGYLLEAVAPLEEAARMYRHLARTNPVHLPDLAGALSNLSTAYGQVGRRQDAPGPAEEAARLYRQLAGTNPALRPDLAGALNNLGTAYGQVGRRQDALASAEEAVRLYRNLAETNPAFAPDLAGTLNNLALSYGHVGRRQDALASAEEAVRLYRNLAGTNPAFAPDFAGALNNLGTAYSQMGRQQEALPPTEEAVRLGRELAGTNPAFRPDLAAALGSLGVRYRQVGRRQDAMAATEEAVRLYRELAGTNPAFLPDLAIALSDLGIRYGEVGRQQDALAPAEEAVRLRRELALTNPAFLPDLAMALNNLGAAYGEVGRRQDALAPVEEAVRLRRELALTNPAFLPNLATALSNLGTAYGDVGREQDALPPTEEAVRLTRELAGTNPAFVPDLAGALNNLGIRYGQVGRQQDALAATEEAVRLYRDLAGTNPAFLPYLAGALNNLGGAYGEVERWQDALAPAEEAVRLRRELADANPAFLPNLATALENLSIRYAEAERRQDALAPAEEAVRLRRELADANPAFLPNLATALENLSIRYAEAERRQDALACGQEAVQLYRELAVGDPSLLPDLATALSNLGSRSNEAGSPGRGEAAWEQAIAEAAPQAVAFLLVARAGAADAGYLPAVAWLARACAVDTEDRSLVDAEREEARRHRGPDPAAFEREWTRLTGMPAPDWLTMDSGLLSSARAWMATETYATERDCLADHPELLEPSADTAIAEALLAAPEDEVARYTALREEAQRDGVDAAYRPLLLSMLAQEFAGADPGRQRVLLAERRDDLLTEFVADGLEALGAQRAIALLDLARNGDTEAVFDAMAEPERFPPLLHALATRADTGSLGPAAVVAYSVTEATDAVFYFAVAAAAGGDRDQAVQLVRQVREADPGRMPAWINELAGIGRHHPEVLSLIPVLTGGAEDDE